jgi:DNA helicase-2/ATP-dependent DNA helicase PcrA
MSSWNRPTFGMPTAASRTPQRRFGTATARSDAAKKAKAGRPVPSLDPGDRVQHDSFGLGTVVALEGAGDNAVASIDFGTEGVKRLLLRYAPVEKL